MFTYPLTQNMIDTRIFVVDGPHGKLVVEATSKADAVNEYASACGYRTVGSPEFAGDAEVWVDRADEGAKYLVNERDDITVHQALAVKPNPVTYRARVKIHPDMDLAALAQVMGHPYTEPHAEMFCAILLAEGYEGHDTAQITPNKWYAMLAAIEQPS